VSRVADSVVAVASPALPPATVEDIARIAPGWALRAAADGEAEVTAIATTVDADRALVLTGADATEALVRERLRFADLIEIAAPFRINAASPLFSPLLLAPDPGNDGTLEPREIMNLPLEGRLAILSDGGAMSMRDAADEVAAVAWAWRAAGVPMVILPRWQSEPAIAQEILAALHQRLRAHDRPESALQAIQARLRERGLPPAAWAGWLLIGN
jgi:hypothetical protein